MSRRIQSGAQAHAIQTPRGAEQEIVLATLGGLTLERQGGGLVFDYRAPRSGLYQLHAADSLFTRNWQPVATLQAEDGNVQFRIPVPAVPLMFYRIVEP